MFGLSDSWFLVLGCAGTIDIIAPSAPSIDRSIDRSSWSERACYTVYSNGTTVWLGPTSRRIHPQREVPISDRVVRYRLAEEPQQAPFGCSSRLYLGKTICMPRAVVTVFTRAQDSRDHHSLSSRPSSCLSFCSAWSSLDQCKHIIHI